MKHRRMEETKIGRLHFLPQPTCFILKFIAQLLHDIGGSADGRSPIIAMFGYFLSRTRHDKTGQGGDIKGILPITACPYDVDGIMSVEVDPHAKLQKSVPESLQFVDGDTAHK